MKFLCEVTEKYSVDTKFDADKLVEAAKSDSDYAVKDYKINYKAPTTKTEEYYIVSIVKVFNDIKAPTTPVEVEYKFRSFPKPVESNDELEDEE